MKATHDSVELVPNGGWDQRILICRCGALVDAFVVVTTNVVVLIDTLLNPQAAREQLALAHPYLTGGRTLLVINTHADWDHCWGNQLFAGPTAEFPAPVIATRRCAERLRSPVEQITLSEMQSREPGRFDEVRLTAPTVLFTDSLAIAGGDLTLELFATPGHTDDHCAMFIPKIGTLLAGDAAEAPFPFVHHAASLPALRDSLQRMIALQPTAALYCHAPETSGPALLDANRDYFATLEARCRTARARGIDPGEIPDTALEQAIGFPFAEALPAGMVEERIADVYRRGHQTHLRLMLEWLLSSAERG